MKPIPENVPDEIRLVILCRAVRRLQRTERSKKGMECAGLADLVRLERDLDVLLEAFDSDDFLRRHQE